ncbi:hypothetical protein DH86_00001364, partial [Scytalidium sp. 3C]
HPEKGTKVYRCPIPGCKSKGRAWPRLDNFTNHIKRLHKQQWDSEDDHGRGSLIRQAENIYEPGGDESQVKDDTLNANSKEVISERVFAVDSLSVQDRDAHWEGSYPGSLEEPVESLVLHSQQLEHSDKAGCQVSEHANPIRKVPPSDPIKFLELVPSQSDVPEKKITLDGIHSGPVGVKGSSNTVVSSSLTPNVGKAARRNKVSAADAPAINRLEATQVGSEAVDEARNDDPLPKPERTDSPGSDSASSSTRTAITNASGTALDVQAGNPASKEDAHPSLDAEQMAEHLRKLGWVVSKESLVHVQSHNAGSAPSNRSVNRELCSVCKKFSGRPCELKKHMKRHERPYGCTFRDCTKEFGSKNDWKRHEKSQHLQIEAWRCNMTSATGECGKVCYRQKTFEDHLKSTTHQIADFDVISSKVDECKLGRDYQNRFWCGFCRRSIVLKRGGSDGWNERFDHIDAHFMGKNSFQPQRIQEWVNMETNKPRGHSPYAQEEGADYETQDAVTPIANGICSEELPTKPTFFEGSSASKSAKRAQSTDLEESRPPAKKARRPAVLLAEKRLLPNSTTCVLPATMNSAPTATKKKEKVEWRMRGLINGPLIARVTFLR